MTFELHPLCTLFPRMGGPEFAALCADIKINGLRSPIVLHDGMILDGGNRYRACQETGARAEFVEFSGSSPVSFVLSANLHRRHMTTGQQAAIVASATDWAKAQQHGGDRRSDQGEALHLETSKQRAAVSGATTRTQKDADKLARENPAKAKEVAQGKTSLYQAVKETKPPKPAQVAVQSSTEAPDDDTNGAPSADEVAEAERSAADDAEVVRLLLESDDKLAALADKCKQQASLIRTLESRIAGLMLESSEQVKIIKGLRRKLDSLESAA
jgi:hypothetical protein